MSEPTPDRDPESDDAERSVDLVAARLYDQLSELAHQLIGGNRGDVSVDATDLVHECYLRLAGLEHFRMLGKSAFMSLAASLLRSILVDGARRRLTQKRGAGWNRTTLTSASEELFSDNQYGVDLLDLDSVLRRLETLDPRQHQIVELRFFAGLTGDEVATHLGIARRTVSKEWTLARAWLKRELER